jgi:hypothetical protein
MTVYKLTVNLDATLAVQNQNGSFNYFKPSVGAEITTDEIDDVKVLNQKFEDLYENVIGPNFSSVVTELVLNTKQKESEGNHNSNNCCGGTSDACDCKTLEIGEKLGTPVHYDSATLLPINSEGLPKEEWE